jgi:hypothetical protein
MIELDKFEEMKLFMRNVRARYTQQLCQARKRKIDWLFTFESWWKMWEESGKWKERGRKAGQYCMARKGDIGPYSVDNVEIVTIEKNSSDGNKGKSGPWKGKKLPPAMVEAMRIRATGIRHSDETKKKISEASKGRIWSEERRATQKPWNKGLKLVK